MSMWPSVAQESATSPAAWACSSRMRCSSTSDSGSTQTSPSVRKRSSSSTQKGSARIAGRWRCSEECARALSCGGAGAADMWVGGAREGAEGIELGRDGGLGRARKWGPRGWSIFRAPRVARGGLPSARRHTVLWRRCGSRAGSVSMMPGVECERHGDTAGRGDGALAQGGWEASGVAEQQEDRLLRGAGDLDRAVPGGGAGDPALGAGFDGKGSIWSSRSAMRWASRSTAARANVPSVRRARAGRTGRRARARAGRGGRR